MKHWLIVSIIVIVWVNTFIAGNTRHGNHTQLVVREVIVKGNSDIPTNSLLLHIPYKAGQLFVERECVKELHASFPRIARVIIEGEVHDDQSVSITVSIEEKKKIDEVVVQGNYHVALKDITKAIKLDTIVAVDDPELAMLSDAIKKLYIEKGFSQVVVATDIINENDVTKAMFNITEGKKSIIRRISFVGNNHVSEKTLRGIIISKEQWLLGFMDKTSAYHPDRVLYGDVHMIEDYYANRGFLHAKVFDVTKAIDVKNGMIDITFHVDEGERYTIGSITMQHDTELSSEQLLHVIGIKTGMVYSRKKIQQAIKNIEQAWAYRGYLFTAVKPSLVPREDDHVVDIAFTYEKGKQVSVNRIDIIGNKKTKDKVIRRKLMFQEGDLLTRAALDYSKAAVETLGFFDARDGVSWDLKKNDEQYVDVNLVVKERKTGNLSGSIGFGGSPQDMRSSSSGLNARIDYSDINFMGSGIQTNLAASWAKDEQTLVLHVAQPWLFDQLIWGVPLSGAFDAYHKRPTYDELKNIHTGIVKERLTGGALTAGFITRSGYQLFQNMNVLFSFGCDHLTYQEQPRAAIPLFDQLQGQIINGQYQTILDASFKKGSFIWFAHNLEQDCRNNPMHPSEGYKWKITAKAGVPTLGNSISFFKCSFDYHWYTTLVDELGLVLHTHAFIGIAKKFGNNTIPFGELFHIGGPASVRGFQFGQIGPRFLKNSTIGAEKAFVLNVELLFPIVSDYSIKGVLFYDGGAGWGNPYTDMVDAASVTGLHFDYRHSVGFGVRLVAPVPLKIDWGFKIDPRKDRLDHRKNELSSEVHFGMSYDF